MPRSNSIWSSTKVSQNTSTAPLVYKPHHRLSALRMTHSSALETYTALEAYIKKSAAKSGYSPLIPSNSGAHSQDDLAPFSIAVPEGLEKHHRCTQKRLSDFSEGLMTGGLRLAIINGFPWTCSGIRFSPILSTSGPMSTTEQIDRAAHDASSTGTAFSRQ